MRIRWLILVLLLWPPKAHAYRVEFIARADGERLRGSEVCLYRGGNGDTPASRFLVSNDVRCLPADEVIDLPSGVWNFYVRHDDGWVSAHGSSLIQRGSANPDQGYRSVEIHLRRAAYITFAPTLPTADRFAVYVPMIESRTYAPAVFPLPSGEHRILVPADEPLVLLRVRDGKPVGAGPLTTLKAGESLDAVELTPAVGERDLIAWVSIDDATRRVIGNDEAPAARLVDTHGAEHLPLYQIHWAGPAHESLVVFPEPTPGHYTLRLAGRQWRTVQVSVNLDASAAEWFIEEPLVARLPRRLTVRWALSANVREIPGRQHSCDKHEQEGEVGEWLADLLTCQAWQPGKRFEPPNDLSRCRMEQRLSVEPKNTGHAIFDLRAPGNYVVIFKSERARLGIAPVKVTAANDVSVELELMVSTVFGRVTEGDRAIPAVVKFETGSALADESGSYRAVLDADPLDNVIEILPCDGSAPFQHLPKERITGSRQYDIHIPKNRVDVRIRDATTGGPIPNASVGRGVFLTAEEARRADSLRGDAVADQDGTLTLRRLEPGYFLRVCAVAEGYKSACADPIELRSEEVVKVTLSLQQRQMHRGRVVAQTPVVAGMLYRTMASGVIVEEIPVNQDGSFAYAGEGSADMIIVTALNHPLFVVPHPPVAGEDELRIAVPPGPARSFTIEISESLPNRSAWYTVAVGDAVVPANVLAAHLTRRGLVAFVEDGGPARAVDIIESAPIRVIAAVGKYPEPVSVSDLFVLPQYFAIREIRPVPPDGRVIFDRH